MIELVIRATLTHFSLVMLIASVVLAAISAWQSRGKLGTSYSHQLFGWLLLLSLGLQGVFTFVLHVFFPTISAANIGWQVSPFQYEVGIANLTVGVLGILAYWANFSFRVAAAIAGVVWYWGDAVGHVRQMIVAHNYASGNAGSWFWTDVLVPILLIVCVLIEWRRREVIES
jgi:hypothetical protein